MFGLTRYQWLVLFAAWLGWGFDVFDGLLFNFVAPLCVPSLLGIKATDPGAKGEIMFWTASLSSLLLLGWAAGGIAFGMITDRLGRTRTLLITMLVYALSTAACAFAPNIWVLALFRLAASFGIGGEWAAGASLVAESMPPKKRIVGGALLYTSAPMGLFLATYVNDLFTRKLEVIASNPHTSWRAVFLTGLIPAIVAFLIRLKVKEPETWSATEKPPAIRELFSPELRRHTLGGIAMAVIALITWWSCSAFIPVIANFLAADAKPSPELLPKLKTQFQTLGSTVFNLGGLIGTLLTVPVATHFGRRPMFAVYYALSALAIWFTFGPGLAPETRLYSMFLIGLTVFGVFGSFTFYLPELFPMRLRGTGSGFCYNIGRVITAAFPFAIGVVATRGYNPIEIIRWVAAVPVLGVIFVAVGLAEETKGREA
ncbi:MAG TPA: MFS transporter [Polyangiales bacterium]|jgi:MFS family permease|nr:MFS transporter [Polyangiales bacterium]